MPTSSAPVLVRTAVHTPNPAPLLTPCGLRAGDMVGAYRIDRPLGRGGMGVVFDAWDTTADRPAAVKVLGTAIPSPTLFSRFQREASTTARLRHPGIVTVYGIGQTHSVCYLAMQRVDGITVREWLGWVGGLRSFSPAGPAAQATPGPAWATEKVDIRFDSAPSPEDAAAAPPPSRPRPAVVSDPRYVRRVAEMLRDLADAISHAHAAGVTHRDLKPENVMVTADGRVVVIDFGLARSFADATLTTHSGLMGTPLYMAPEQLVGKPADARSDVYALGLIGYELLTHSLPFRAGTVERLLGEVMYKPPPPLTGRNPVVPPGLANVVHRAMAKKAADRYPTAAELRDDLEHYLHGERVTATGYKYRFNARALAALRPKRVTAAGYAVALFGGMLGLFGVFAAAMNAKPSSLLTAVVGGGFLFVAWWLLSGRRGARAGGLAVAGLLLAFVAWATWQAFTVSMNGAPPLMVAALIAIPLAVAGGLIASLLGRRAGDWFRRVRDERAEFAADGRAEG